MSHLNCRNEPTIIDIGNRSICHTCNSKQISKFRKKFFCSYTVVLLIHDAEYITYGNLFAHVLLVVYFEKPCYIFKLLFVSHTFDFFLLNI